MVAPARASLSVNPLASWRKQALLSQRALAARAGISYSTLALIELGRSTPRLSTMAAICRVLGIQPTQVAEFRAAVGADPAGV